MTQAPPTVREITSQFRDACPDCRLGQEDIKAEDVAAIDAYADHSTDEEERWALLRLRDGRLAIWNIWADYTGHG